MCEHRHAPDNCTSLIPFRFNNIHFQYPICDVHPHKEAVLNGLFITDVCLKHEVRFLSSLDKVTQMSSN